MPPVAVLGALMQCPSCSSENPEAAHYCYRCGTALRGTGRERAYVVQPGESLRQFALISTIMPHSNREVADNFRWALGIGGVVVVGLTLLGILPAAYVAAAALVPLVYLIYIYDVNLWQDAPARTVLILFVLTGVLATLVSLAFREWLFEAQFVQLVTSRAGVGGSIAPLVLFSVALPVVAEIAKNVGGVALASRPAYDDMIDGLTFGIAAGTAYAMFETIVFNWDVIASGDLRTTTGLVNAFVVILNFMIIKAIIYGTATGIAVATYSGIGAGYDGFTPAYFAAVIFAAGMNVLYWLGVRLLAGLDVGGAALGLVWGVLIAAVLIVRVRVMMQAALLEAALEDAANDRRSAAATTDGGFCPECEMPLLPDAVFCVACGASLRAASTPARNHMRTASTTGGAA